MTAQSILVEAIANEKRLKKENKKLSDALRLIVKKSQALLTNPNCADISSIAEKALK